MPDPVFTADDRVDNDALPPELVGKTPKQIAEYYNRQNQILADQLDRAQRTPTPAPAPEKKEVKFDIFNDAEGSVDRKVNERVNEALKSATGVIARIVPARNRARPSFASPGRKRLVRPSAAQPSGCPTG